MKKVCIYTCITGDYDNLKEVSNIEDDFDYICFTNNKNITSSTWKIINIEDNIDNAKLARKIKILGHNYIKENYDMSIWVDANFYDFKFTKFIDDYREEISKYSLIGFKHSVRNCAYKEAEKCIKMEKDNPELIKKEIIFLKKENYPDNNGLIESGFLFRKHNDVKVFQTMNIWFDMVLNYSKRDQISFNYSAFKTAIDFKLLELNIYNNIYFKVDNHNLDEFSKFYSVYYDFGKGFSEGDRDDFLYINKKGNKIIKLDILPNLKKLRIDFGERKFIKYKIISSDIKGKFEICNMIKVGDYFISTNDDPQIIIDVNDLKKSSINIILNIDEINVEDSIGFLIKNELEIKEKEELKKENEIISLKYNELDEKYNNLLNCYNNIINSKRWKYTDKIINIINKLRIKK